MPALDFLSVLVGAAIPLAAAYVAYALERRILRKQRQQQQFAEVRRYLEAYLRLSDYLIDWKKFMGGNVPRRDRWTPEDMKRWKEEASAHVRLLKDLPVARSSRAVIIQDKEILERLAEFDEEARCWMSWFQDVMMNGSFATFAPGGAEGQRAKLVALAESLSNRMAELVDKD